MTYSLSKEQIEKLVVKAQKHDEQAFSELFEHFFQPLHRYISFRSDDEDTEDILSETWLRIVQNLERYVPQRTASFKSWVYRIAHNKVIDYYRTHKSHLSIDTNSDTEDIPYSIELETKNIDLLPDKKFEQEVNAKEIREYILTLDPVQRDVIELKYLEELTNAEISEILGKSEGNIRVIQLRALRALRKQIER